MRLWKSVMIGVLGAAAFMLTTSQASASTITTSGTRFTGVAAGTLTFDPGGLNISCDITFSIAVAVSSFTAVSLPALVPNVGTVSARAGSCTGGFTMTFLNVPWRFDLAVSGVPGNVTGNTTMTVKNLQFQLSTGAFTCLWAGNMTGGLNSAGTTLNVNSSIPLVSGSIFCWNPSRLTGTVSLSPVLTLRLT